MWKCFILCTFNPHNSLAAKNGDGNEKQGENRMSAKSFFSFLSTAVMKDH